VQPRARRQRRPHRDGPAPVSPHRIGAGPRCARGHAACLRALRPRRRVGEGRGRSAGPGDQAQRSRRLPRVRNGRGQRRRRVDRRSLGGLPGGFHGRRRDGRRAAALLSDPLRGLEARSRGDDPLPGAQAVRGARVVHRAVRALDPDPEARPVGMTGAVGPRPYPFSAVVGQDGLRLALTLLAVDPGIGGVLIRGQKGTAKTTAVRGLAALVPPSSGAAAGAGDGGRAPFVELPLGATEDRVVGSLDLHALADTGRPSFRPGLLGDAHGGILYVDEVNLLADHLVDVLLDAAASGSLTVERDGVSHTAPARFALVGTMNPEEGELRPQLLDRFGLAVDVAGPADATERVEIVRRRREYEADPESFGDRFAPADERVGADVVAARGRLADVVLPDREMTRIALVCLEVGVEGMRADVVIARTAGAHAALAGRGEVSEEDVRVAASPALPHRRRRGPFGPAEMDPGELDEAMDAADEQRGPDDGPDGPDDDPDGPGDDPDGDGPGDGGPDGGPDGGGGPTAPGGREPSADDEGPTADEAA